MFRVQSFDQLVVGAVPGDAIFNEALFIQRALKARGYSSRIYAERISPALPRGVALDVRAYRPRRDSTLIFHYSIGSSLNELVRSYPVRLVLIYHNITPPEYFRGVNPQIEAQLAQGRAELGSFKQNCVLALADSEFNQLELKESGYARTGVLPLAFTLGQHGGADEAMSRLLRNGAVNLLFVGRIAPNKKQDDLIRLLYACRQLNPQARLLLVGSWGSTERYFEWLKTIVASLELREQVVFAGHVADRVLRAYYQSADLFVCMSEHEGFCAPLVEAMSIGVPVVAYASTGVPYTLGDAGVLIHEKRWDVVAALCETILTDRRLRDGLVARQRERAKQFAPEVVRARLEQYLDLINL